MSQHTYTPCHPVTSLVWPSDICKCVNIFQQEHQATHNKHGSHYPAPFQVILCVVTDTLHWFMQIACMDWNHEKSLIVPSAGRAFHYVGENLFTLLHACGATCNNNNNYSKSFVQLSRSCSFTRLTRSNYANFNAACAAKVNATCCMFALLNWCTLKHSLAACFSLYR